MNEHNSSLCQYQQKKGDSNETKGKSKGKDKGTTVTEI